MKIHIDLPIKYAVHTGPPLYRAWANPPYKQGHRFVLTTWTAGPWEGGEQRTLGFDGAL